MQTQASASAWPSFFCFFRRGAGRFSVSGDIMVMFSGVSIYPKYTKNDKNSIERADTP
jgi:hypothetical protein